jgi:ATP-GRASP peptide maturase of grasp-with-spasm system
MELKVFSTSNDHSTNIVFDWIQYKKSEIDLIRINDDFFEENEILKIDSFGEKKKKEFVWLRKWDISKYLDVNKFPLKYREVESLSNFILNNKNKKFLINNPNNLKLSKPFQLEVAVDSDLTIPATIITNNKRELKKFFKTYKKIITKPLCEPVIKVETEKSYASYTRIIDNDEIEDLPDLFHFSLFQELIVKVFEIRTFYFFEKFYSMAIFSQSDDQTKVDFRNYNLKKPNRTIPYNLPIQIQKKLIDFMKKIKLNSGSIDICKTVDGQYIFLEVNPFGQFGMVSKPCNYYIEKDISYYLIKKMYDEE